MSKDLFNGIAFLSQTGSPPNAVNSTQNPESTIEKEKTPTTSETKESTFQMKTSIWTQDFTSMENDNELLDQEYADSLMGDLGMSVVLEKATDLQNKIKQYLEDNNVPFTSSDTIVEHQSYTIEDKQYLLENATHLEHLYKLILDFSGYRILEKSFK